MLLAGFAPTSFGRKPKMIDFYTTGAQYSQHGSNVRITAYKTAAFPLGYGSYASAGN